MLYLKHMQDVNTPDLGSPDQQGFYRPSKASAFATPQDDNNYTQPPKTSNTTASLISWDASEYAEVEKNAIWVICFLAVALAIFGAAIWLAAWTFAVVIVVMTVAMGVFAFRKPQILHYELTNSGIIIDNKEHNYNEFRTFGVLPEDDSFTMVLIPVQRFMPSTNIYFPAENGEKIVDIVGSHLPLQDMKRDPIDSLMHILRF
jgi:hypothetical protein